MATNPDAILKFGQLQTYDSKLKPYIDGRFELVKSSTTTTGSAATYVLQTTDSSHKLLGKVDIPKDTFVQSAAIGTSTENDKPEAGFKAGDQYIELTIDTADSNGTGTKLYINVGSFMKLEYATDEDIDSLFTSAATPPSGDETDETGDGDEGETDSENEGA